MKKETRGKKRRKIEKGAFFRFVSLAKQNEKREKKGNKKIEKKKKTDSRVGIIELTFLSSE